jgi:hypothetical protein
MSLGLVGLMALFGSNVGCSEDGSLPADATVSHSDTTQSDAAKDDATSTQEAGTPTCYGAKYPTGKTIDPDNPDYEDAVWTKADVKKQFAAAKAANTDAYKAYKAALAVGRVLECAYCVCGCVSLESHKSAVDCFVDMHGFG